VKIRTFEFPDDLCYLVQHDTWARLDPDGAVTVGLTSLGAHISGEFIEFMPKSIGTEVERERSLGVLEMSKVIRAARSPIAGRIVAHNESATRRASLINEDPYGGGWLVRLLPNDWAADAARLASGTALVEAVEEYMGFLAETFDQRPPG
jgi:glycine cleavage system H protein